MSWMPKHRFLSAIIGILLLALLAYTIGGVVGLVIQTLLVCAAFLGFIGWRQNRRRTKEANNAKLR